MSVGSAAGERDEVAFDGRDTGIDGGTASCCNSGGAGGFETASAAAYKGMKKLSLSKK